MLESTLDYELHKGNQEYASFWYRVGASLVDMLVFTPIIIGSFYNTMEWKNLGLAILLALIGFFYKPLMEYYFGATLGKMAMKIKVLNSQFDDISIGQAFIRAFPWVISTAVNIFVTVLMFNDPDFYDANGFMAFSVYSGEFAPTSYNNYAAAVLLLSIVFMFWEKKKQTLHDKVANTIVVKLS